MDKLCDLKMVPSSLSVTEPGSTVLLASRPTRPWREGAGEGRREGEGEGGEGENVPERI